MRAGLVILVEGEAPNLLALDQFWMERQQNVGEVWI